MCVFWSSTYCNLRTAQFVCSRLSSGTDYWFSLWTGPFDGTLFAAISDFFKTSNFPPINQNGIDGHVAANEQKEQMYEKITSRIMDERHDDFVLKQ